LPPQTNLELKKKDLTFKEDNEPHFHLKIETSLRNDYLW